VNQSTVDINDSDDDNNANDADNEEEISIPTLKVTSYKEAVTNLEDALQFLQSKGDIITANELSKVIFQTQNDWLHQRNNQSKVTDYFTKS
jgi:hypothetical protein